MSSIQLVVKAELISLGMQTDRRSIFDTENERLMALFAQVQK